MLGESRVEGQNERRAAWASPARCLSKTCQYACHVSMAMATAHDLRQFAIGTGFLHADRVAHFPSWSNRPFYTSPLRSLSVEPDGYIHSCRAMMDAQGAVKVKPVARALLPGHGRADLGLASLPGPPSSVQPPHANDRVQALPPLPFDLNRRRLWPACLACTCRRAE